MKQRFEDFDIGSVVHFDLGEWPNLPFYEIDFPVKIEFAIVSGVATRSKPPYLVLRLYDAPRPSPEDHPSGMLILYRRGKPTKPVYSHDAYHWKKPDPLGIPLTAYDVVCESPERPESGGELAQQIGQPAWFNDGELQLRDRSDGVLVHADEDFVWIRGVGVIENLVNIVAISDIERLTDKRAAADGDSSEASRADVDFERGRPRKPRTVGDGIRAELERQRSGEARETGSRRDTRKGRMRVVQQRSAMQELERQRRQRQSGHGAQSGPGTVEYHERRLHQLEAEHAVTKSQFVTSVVVWICLIAVGLFFLFACIGLTKF